MTSTQHVYEIRPRSDKRGFDLISDVLPFGRLWYGEANAIGYAKGKVLQPLTQRGVGADWIPPLELDVYLDAAQAPLKVPKHFVSAIRSLIDSTSKLCRVDERVAKGTFPALSLEPVDSLLDQLATFRACNFQR